MAKIEDLIGQIAEPRLRTEIASEIKKLKAQKKFGLVFEEHLPETVRLPGYPVQPGELVSEKRTSGSDLWLVKSANSRTARCIRPEGTYTAEQKDFSVKDLVVVKRFGEPIYPVMIPVDRINRGGTDKPWHTLISADNFHALQLLLYCYEGQVDVINIDPPYNTGARDWKYNNDYVDKTDLWRHSKWLSMMKKRLLLAKRLLKHDGVIAVAVDDWEMHHLTVLMNELFPGWSRHVIVTMPNPRGKGGANFSRVHEYLCVYVAPLGLLEPLPRIEEQTEENGEDVNQEPDGEAEIELDSIKREIIAPLRRWGQGSKRADRQSMFFPIFVDTIKLKIVEVGDPLALHEKPIEKRDGSIVSVFPIDKKGIERRWRYGRDGVLKELQQGKLRVVLENNRIEIKRVEPPTTTILPKSLWLNKEYTGQNGAKFLKQIFARDDVFPFPKSPYVVEEFLRCVSHNRPEALILDFFAGSGTTFHATALLNAEDGGHRRCILITNNEVTEKLAKALIKQGHFPGSNEFERHGIAETATWPRCKYVINGRRDDGTELAGKYLDGREMKDGFQENMEYYKLDFVDPNAVSLGQAFEAILPILWMNAGCIGMRESSRGSKPWFIPQKSPFAVLIKEQQFPVFRKELKERKDITHVFFVTDSEENFSAMSKALGLKVETVQLYKSYLDNFRINTRLPGLL